jgi:hypothetical protein
MDGLAALIVVDFSSMLDVVGDLDLAEFRAGYEGYEAWWWGVSRADVDGTQLAFDARIGELRSRRSC